MIIVLLFAFSYFIGAIPFSLIIGKLSRGIDIREHGSCNVGATNVLRTCGTVPGILAFLSDTLKGVLPVIFTSLLIKDKMLPNYYDLVRIGVGFGTIIGHNWSFFIKFKGGKGVAVSLGVFLALCFKPSVLSFLVFVIVVWLTRYVSLGSICAAILFPLFVFLFGSRNVILFFSLFAAFIIIWRHKTNISRLIKGKENRISFSRKI